jgi:hypothetical protein
MKKVLLAIALVCGIVGVAEAQTVNVGTNCTITWNANIENDLAGYRVYGLQGGVTKTVDIAKPTVTTTCAALGTQAGGALTIQVDAVDLVGNRSPKSASVIANQDIAAPTQPSGLSVTPNP